MSSERATIMRHAGTVMVGQLAVMAFSITDTLVAGHFADTALAALAVASATYVTVHISLMGMLQALLPVWAELHGAQRHAEVGRSVRQALYLCAITASLGMWALLCPDLLLNWTQVPPGLQAEVRDYLSIVAFGLPASLLFRMYSTLNQSLGKPKLVTWVQVGALMVKIPLSIVLVLGIPNVLPPMGLAGCAWATLVVMFFMLGLAAAHARLLQALSHLGHYAKTASANLTKLRTLRPTQWLGHWRRGHILHAHVVVHCTPRRGGHRKPSDRVQHDGCAVHDPLVSLHRQQFSCELLDRCRANTSCATGAENGPEPGAAAQPGFGRIDWLAASSHCTVLYPIHGSGGIGCHLAFVVDAVSRSRCSASVLCIHAALLWHHGAAAHHLHGVAMGLGLGGRL